MFNVTPIIHLKTSLRQKNAQVK